MSQENAGRRSSGARPGVPGLDDRLSRGALGLALEVRVLDGDAEPKLTLLELPSDAALAGQSAPVSDRQARGL